jgi:hypothetical protein
MNAGKTSGVHATNKAELPPFPSGWVYARHCSGAWLQYIQEGWIMDFFFFFFGLLSTIAGLIVIKKSTPNVHH